MIRSETRRIGPAGRAKIVAYRRIEIGPLVYESEFGGGQRTRRIYLK